MNFNKGLKTILMVEGNTDSFVIYIKEKPKLKKFEVTYCIPKFQTEIKEFESIGDAQDYAESLALVDGVYDVKEIE